MQASRTCHGDSHMITPAVLMVVWLYSQPGTAGSLGMRVDTWRGQKGGQGRTDMEGEPRQEWEMGHGGRARGAACRETEGG
jgi:hypothetical protein